MSDGRTIWRAKDALWHEREWIVTLVDEFGPAGYAVIDYLENQAKMQNDAGRVKTGPRAVARATGTDVVTVGHVVSRAVTLGLLDEHEEHDGRFTFRITWFVADQGRAMATGRKAAQRARESVNKGDPPPKSRLVTVSHAESSDVTLTGQNRTEPSSLRSDGARKRAPSKKADQGQLPASLPTDLHSTAFTVLERLRAVQAERGGNEPTLRGVGLAVQQFPDRDHLSVLSELESWALAGRGAGKPVVDWPRTFATFLRNSPPGKPVATVPPIVPQRHGPSELLRMLDQPVI